MENNQNNQQNQNQSNGSDPFYSYQNGANGSTYGNTNGANGGTYGNTNGRQYTYGDQSAGYQQNGSYQNGGWQNQPYPGGQESGKKPRKKKEHGKGGFGVKLVKCAALALVFGLVSGVVFQGVQVASDRFSGKDNVKNEQPNVLNEAKPGDSVASAATASNYVANDVSDIVEHAMPSIVAITNVSETEYRSFWGGMPQTYETASAGSGIIVGQDDKYLYIATNNHVVEGATSLTVNFNDNSTVSAEVKGTDPSMDLAVIRVALDSMEPETMDAIKVATFGNSDDLRIGNSCIAIGNALGHGQSVTVGYISALGREVAVSDSASGTSYTAELIQTDAAINPGNSGGALLSANGEVIGINSVKYADTSVEGIGYAIPIATAGPIINDLITKEKVDESDSAYLGIAGVDVTRDVSETYNMPSGVYIAQVTAGSAAEQAGIQKGDIITEFDGKEIDSMEKLSNTLQYYKAESVVEMKLKRSSNGEYVEQTISVKLGRKK